MDKIKIKNLEVYARHGVFPEENKLGQKFLINAILHTDLRSAGESDDLTKSIDYGFVCGEITKFLQENTFKLIETAAEKLAAYLLLSIRHLKGIELEICKPWAPVGLPLENVSVEINRQWHEVYIALGSNMGKRENFLTEAVEKMKEIKEITVEKVSSIIETAPYGGVEQNCFLNSCLKLYTILSPEELLQKMHRIEAEAGRERKIHWGPRTLDLDIIFYDNLVTEDEHLLLPHPDMQNRDFVLRPLMELCPFKRHPVTGKTVKEMFLELF